MIVKLLQVLHKINLLSPFGLYRFISSIYKEGINIMLLLNIAERTYGDKIALVDGNETLSYKQLSAQCQKLSMVLKESYNIQEGHRVAFLCKNHVSLVQSIFAVSRLGADIYLLNSEMSKSQFNQLVEEHHFNLLVYDYELNAYMEESPYSKANILSYHDTLPAINNLLHTTVAKNQKILRSSTSKIILLTSGTTGKSKEVTHKPSILNF